MSSKYRGHASQIDLKAPYSPLKAHGALPWVIVRGTPPMPSERLFGAFKCKVEKFHNIGILR